MINGPYFPMHLILLYAMKCGNLLLILIILLSANQLKAQKDFAIDGYVYDQSTGDPISGARVSVNKRNLEVFTNRYGYFTLSVPPQEIVFVVEYQGFYPDSTKMFLEEDLRKKIYLKPHLTDGRTNFEISTASQSVISDPQSSKIDVPIGTLKQIPYLFCENDVVKGLQMLPGVDFGVEGTSDLVIRGGEVGQNLMLLDGTPVYSQGHFFGYISNFNTGIINNIQVYKGAFPARFGGRVSSVIDITSNSGSKEDVTGSFTLSPILANLNVGMPLDNRGSSIAINGRRSYIDILLAPALGGDELRFGDFQSKLDLVLSDKDVVTFSFYSLKDKLSFSLDSDDTATSVTYDISLEENNKTATLRWNRSHNHRLFSSISGSYSGYKNAQTFVENNFNPLPGNPTRVKQDIRFFMGDFAVNGDFEFNKSNQHFVRFGMQNIVHSFLPGRLTEEKFDNQRNLMSSRTFGDSTNQYSLETAFYVEDDWRVNDKLKITAGLRAVLYAHKNSIGLYPEPRITGRQRIDSISSFKFSFMRVNQFVHLYNNGSTEQELIVWIPATSFLKPENSNQFTLGYARKIKKNWEWLSDVYYKTLGNQLLFYTIDYFDEDVFTRNAMVGKGSAYGWENYLKLNYESFSTWLSYNLSVSNRTFDELNRGEAFFFDYDRRHTVKANMVMSMEQWLISANLIVGTGNPFTLPNAKYRDLDGRLILSYESINNFRSNTYFRTDVKIQYFWGSTNGLNNSIEFCIYNLTSSPNAASIYAELDRDFSNEKYKVMQSTNFKIVPFVSYKLTL